MAMVGVLVLIKGAVERGEGLGGEEVPALDPDSNYAYVSSNVVSRTACGKKTLNSPRFVMKNSRPFRFRTT